MKHLTEWARVVAELRHAREERLREVGYTESSLRELEQKAVEEMGGRDVVETEYGVVQLIPDKPVTWRPVSSANPDKLFRKRLVVLRKE